MRRKSAATRFAASKATGVGGLACRAFAWREIPLFEDLLRRSFCAFMSISWLVVPVLFSSTAGGAVWNSGSGVWENANSWDTQVVPDSSSEDVLISALGNVQVDLDSNRTTRSLTLNASNDRLHINPGGRLQVDGPSLINRGVIELEASAGQSSEDS